MGPPSAEPVFPLLLLPRATASSQRRVASQVLGNNALSPREAFSSRPTDMEVSRYYFRSFSSLCPAQCWGRPWILSWEDGWTLVVEKEHHLM